MNLDVKHSAAAVAAALAIGFLFGRHSVPSKVETKTETTSVATDDKTVNDMDDKDEVIDKTIEKDGTVKEEIHITDKKDTVTTDKAQVDTVSKSDTITTNINDDWNVSLLATPSHLDDTLFNTGSMAYGLHIQRRILGPFSIGVFGLTNKTYGISGGFSF